MLSVLENLQYGNINPKSFARVEATQRFLNLELSNRRDLEKIHNSAINTLDIEQIDQRYLLSGCNTGSIAIHDLYNYSGKMTHRCKAISSAKGYLQRAHSFSVETVQWYPFDTGLFTSSGMDSILKLWDTSRMMSVDTYKLRGKIYAHSMPTVDTHRTLIAVASTYPHVVLVDIRAGSQCHELRGHKGHTICLQWSPYAEHLLATGGKDNMVLLWDIRSAKKFLSALDQHNGQALGSRNDLITAHNGFVNGLCFSSNGLHLVSFGTDHQIRLWDVATSKNTLVNFGKVSNYSHTKVQIDMCDDASVPVIFAPYKSRVNMYNMFSGELQNSLIGHFNGVNCCICRTWYHELYSGGFDRNILMWTPDIEREVADDSESGNDPTGGDAWSDDD